MINCGILFNAKQNSFASYLKWILSEEQASDYFNISGILTNDFNFLKENSINLVESQSLEDLIDKSDIIFSLGYWRIIKKEQLTRVPRGIINFHHSYRLKYRGRHCATWVIRNKEKFHGSTMHFMDEKLDEGKIIDTRCFLVDREQTAEDLFFKANEIGLSMLKDNFKSTLEDDHTQLSLMTHDKDFKYFKNSDLNHEISNKFIKDKELFLNEILSLTFDKKKSPYVMLGNKKVYLKLESHDDGILKKMKQKDKNIGEYRISQHTRSPFKIWVVDNFLKQESLDQILNEWPDMSDSLWHSGHKKVGDKENTLEHLMLSISSKDGLSDTLKDFLDFVHNDDTTEEISEITNVQNLISDKTMRWSGLRMMLPKSFQLIHSDARRHPNNNLRKEITCLLYLSEGNDGYLECWNDDMTYCVHKVKPKINRLVIFQNTDKSYHGVPKVSFLRKCITWSIMSDEDSINRSKALFVKRPEDPESVRQIGIERSRIGDKND